MLVNIFFHGYQSNFQPIFHRKCRQNYFEIFAKTLKTRGNSKNFLAKYNQFLVIFLKFILFLNFFLNYNFFLSFLLVQRDFCLFIFQGKSLQFTQVLNNCKNPHKKALRKLLIQHLHRKPW